MRSAARRAGVFVLVIALVVSAATAGALVVGDDGPDRLDATVDNDYYVSDSLVENSALTPAEGEITFDDDGTEKTVLIRHDGPDDDIEPFVNALVTAGHEVSFFDGTAGADPAAGPTAEPENPLNASLREADAFVVIGDVDGFTAADLDGIEAFAEADGRVLLADDLSAGGLGAPIVIQGQAAAAPVDAGSADAAARFGVALGNGYLYNMYENDANYQRVFATGAESSLASGVDRIVADAPVPVWSEDGTPIATGVEETRYSTTREDGEYHVGVEVGNVVVLGDTDVFTPLNYNRADNEVLLGNVLEFLTTGEKDPADAPRPPESADGGMGEYPPEHPPEQPPEDGDDADSGEESGDDSVSDDDSASDSDSGSGSDSDGAN